MAETKAKGERSWVGFLFGLVFFGMGSSFMWFMGLKPIGLSLYSQTWPNVACTVIHSELLSFRGDDGTTYRPEIRVRHYYGDIKYEGGSYSFNNASSSGRSGKQKVISAYPVGTQTRCWVNPNKPQQAVISRSIPGMVWFVIPFTSIFVLIGLAFMLASLSLIPKKWVLSRNHRRVATESTGMMQLKPGVSRGGKLVGGIVFTAFWNGIVSVFVFQVYKGFSQGNPEWFLVIFLIPFVLVGLAGIGYVVYLFLALFNAKPTLFASEGSPKLGQNVNLNWDITGDITKVTGLCISLEGAEKATYRVGTNTRTDTHCFYKKELLNIQDVSNALSKSIAFKVPEELMHSFKSSNNEIEWAIKLEGDVPRWPNIKQEYPIVVRPR